MHSPFFIWYLISVQIEIATVKDQVSSSALGRIRMQWWRDTISSVYKVNYLAYYCKFCALIDSILLKSSPPQHPVALALYDTVQGVNVPLYHFKRMVDARVSILT